MIKEQTVINNGNRGLIAKILAKIFFYVSEGDLQDEDAVNQAVKEYKACSLMPIMQRFLDMLTNHSFADKQIRKNFWFRTWAFVKRG